VKLSAAVANSAWLASSLPAWARFQRELHAPAEAQLQVLTRILRNNANNAYGRACGFRDIDRYAQFQERVPIMDYDTLAPWITRISRKKIRSES